MKYHAKHAVGVFVLLTLCCLPHTDATSALDQFTEQLSASSGSGFCRVGSGVAGTPTTVRGITQEQCASRCLAQSDCTLIEYNFASTGTCELHTEPYAFTSALSGYVCMVRNSVAPDPTQSPTQSPTLSPTTPLEAFTERFSSSGDSGICRLGVGNGGVSGVDYINLRNAQGISSLADCASACLTRPACNFIEYQENSASGSKICEIHYGVFSYTVASSTSVATRLCLTRNSVLDDFTKQLASGLTPPNSNSGLCRDLGGVEGPKTTIRNVANVVACADLCLADDLCTHIEFIPDYNGGNCELHTGAFGLAITESTFEDAVCLTRNSVPLRSLSPTQSPTESPTLSPTISPTESPTLSPTTPCSSFTQTFTLTDVATTGRQRMARSMGSSGSQSSKSSKSSSSSSSGKSASCDYSNALGGAIFAGFETTSGLPGSEPLDNVVSSVDVSGIEGCPSTVARTSTVVITYKPQAPVDPPTYAAAARAWQTGGTFPLSINLCGCSVSISVIDATSAYDQFLDTSTKGKKGTLNKCKGGYKAQSSSKSAKEMNLPSSVSVHTQATSTVVPAVAGVVVVVAMVALMVVQRRMRLMRLEPDNADMETITHNPVFDVMSA